MDWLSECPYTAETEPQIDPNSNSAVFCPVPGYWEDMTDLFRSTALHTKLKWNPHYILQRYPQAGYVPDMVLPNPVGCFVYQRTIMLDDLPRGETELRIGGVQNAVSAWVNGVYLGRHEGYSTPFGFEVPIDALIVGENRITMAVSNIRLAGYMGRPVSGLTSRAANECTGGIWGDVQLCSYPDCLRNLYVCTSQDCTSFAVNFSKSTVAKTVRIWDGNKCLGTKEIPAEEEKAFFSTEGFTFWSPDIPKLYTAEVSTENQTISIRFGIRRLTVDGTKLLLNREPYFFRGTCEHCYQPMTVHPTRDKSYYRMVIRRLKGLGFNSIRFHTWVPPQEYMEAADELGMVMEIESPNNTSFEEWKEIVRFCRGHAAVNLYSTGNELQIDADYEKHLEACSNLVHSETDALFSPMSAMRGIEYQLTEDETVELPFRHNPARLGAVGKYCDVYNSYSLGMTSYFSASGTQKVLDERNAIYGKPLLSHEICIQGTWIDLSLEERYNGTRIGDTELFSSVRRHLENKGMLEKSNLYYRNSAAWQQILRKHCFETVRRCETFAGYDFLGDIDTHSHTFGYCVGMMNEFYELKPGETAENVRRYNSDTVLLADLPDCVNYAAGEVTEIPVLVSHYGKDIPKATLHIRISGGGKVFYRKELRVGEIPRGAVTKLYEVIFRMPKCENPMALTLTAQLSGGDTDCENQWDMYVFPKNVIPSARTLKEKNVVVMDNCDGTTLWYALNKGKNVVLLGTGPFSAVDVSWQISLAGRTNGHLATVIADHPLMKNFPHQGYCGRQFECLLNGSHSVVLDEVKLPHNPILDIASAYKNVRREAMIAEYKVGKGKLLICTLNMTERDPAARWLKNQIMAYAASEEFQPAQELTEVQFVALCKDSCVITANNANEAMNKNDITM